MLKSSLARKFSSLLTELLIRLPSLLLLSMCLASCASLQRPVPVPCPIMPAPPAEAMHPPQYQQKAAALLSTPPQASSVTTATQTPK